MEFGEQMGYVLVDINYPNLLVMESNCTTCTDMGMSPFYTRGESQFYWPLNVPDDLNLTQVTAGFEFDAWPAED